MFLEENVSSRKGKHIIGNRDSLTSRARALCLRHEIKDFKEQKAMPAGCVSWNSCPGCWKQHRAFGESLSEWVKVTQSCPTLCDPIECLVHGILQARILEWVSFPFSRESSQYRNRTQVSHIASRFFTSCATREAPNERSRKKRNSKYRGEKKQAFSSVRFCS